MNDSANLIEPFGQPDGSSDDIDQSRKGIVSFPSRFGGISRDPADAKVRVVVGQLGSGKSLQLRRMQDHVARDGGGGQVACEVEVTSELTTESVVKFSELMKLSGGSTEDWKLLWRRGIARSAITHILFSNDYRRHAEGKAASAELRKNLRFLGSPETPHKVTQEVESMIQAHHTGDSLKRHLSDTRWADIENWIAEILSGSAGLNLYIDDVDKNFRWAPALWIQCQRGLFYAVMDSLRNDAFRSKLHTVMALRDIAFSSVKISEQASRYIDTTHISILSWNRVSMQYLLSAKLQSIPDMYFSDRNDRSIKSWLGRESIRNGRRDSHLESLEQYLIRHTTMVPRDLIRMGNSLCQEIRGLDGGKPSELRIREIVSECAAASATRQASQCANQILSDLIPVNAFRRDFHHVYVRPNMYALQENRDHVFECIASTETESFDIETVGLIDELATELFKSDVPVRMTDVLWQQGLLGFVDQSGGGHFYKVDSLDGSNLSLPKHRGVGKYVWNPVVFDLQLALESTLPEPVWPE